MLSFVSVFAQTNSTSPTASVEALDNPQVMKLLTDNPSLGTISQLDAQKIASDPILVAQIYSDASKQNLSNSTISSINNKIKGSEDPKATPKPSANSSAMTLLCGAITLAAITFQ